MSDEIKVGDLVMVVRGHSCVLQCMGGIPYLVDKVGTLPGDRMWHCPTCSSIGIEGSRAYARLGSAGNYPQSFLIKIDPPAVPVEQEEDTAA